MQLCCVTRRWLVTKEMIQQQYGCCGSKEDTMYVKRIKDISFDSNCFCSVRSPSSSALYSSRYPQMEEFANC